MALLQCCHVGPGICCEMRGVIPQAHREFDNRGSIMQTGLRCLYILLLLGAVAHAGAQQQSLDKRQQSKQAQRMFHAGVNHHDAEIELDDPAVANQVTYEQTLADSGAVNVDSRELTIDDLRRPRFVPAPISADGMQFVPGRGYIAGSAEEVMEPGLSPLAASLGAQLSVDQNLPQDKRAFGTDAHTVSATPFQPLDHLGSEIGQKEDPLEKQASAGGLASPLSRPPSAVTSPQQTGSFDLLDRAPAGQEPFAVSWRSRNSSRCESDVNLSAVHDAALLQRLARGGCRMKPGAPRDELTSRGLK